MDDPEATQLVLEALLTVRGMVADIHRAIFDDQDGDAGEAEEEVDS